MTQYASSAAYLHLRYLRPSAAYFICAICVHRRLEPETGAHLELPREPAARERCRDQERVLSLIAVRVGEVRFVREIKRLREKVDRLALPRPHAVAGAEVHLEQPR